MAKNAFDSLKPSKEASNYDLKMGISPSEDPGFIELHDKLKASADSVSRTLEKSRAILTGLAGIVNTYESEGTTPYKPPPLTENSLNTSHLAGAQGGLGEAKVINIHIGTMQQNNGVKGKDLEEHAENAVGELVRALNNIAYQQSRTQ
jgi:hypothetical protein